MQKRMAKTAIAACVVEIQAGVAPEAIQITPDGEFRAKDGRPFDAPSFRVDEVVARHLIARQAASANDIVIDYEHQTLNAEMNGQPAPAAGWFRDLMYRPGSGVWATGVRWTARAKGMIEAGEYRYLSPVFRYLPETGDIVEILHVALTNFPAVDGMNELTAKAAARFSFDAPQEDDMDQLRKLFGLPATAGETEIMAAATALKQKADATETEVAALKTQAPDPAKYVPVQVVTDLRTELAALRAAVDGRELDTVVADALADGRLLPAMETWARELGKKDLAALKGYIAAAQPIAALKGTQSGGKGPAGGNGGELTDEQMAVCKHMGIAPEEYKKSLAAGV